VIQSFQDVSRWKLGKIVKDLAQTQKGTSYLFDFIKCQSLEKLVIDNVICGVAYRLIEGISQRDDPIALDLFKGFDANTQFLSMPHTREWFREEHTYTKLIDRDPYEVWTSLGSKTIVSRAKEEMENLLQKNPPSLLDSGIQTELRKIMLFEMQKLGLSSLPEIVTPEV
jgi:trimethylamine--corrinoid protein Co-methyltransferase